MTMSLLHQLLTRCSCVLASVMLALASFPGTAAGQFQGVVQTRNTTVDDMGQSQTYMMTMRIRDGMLRVEIPASGGGPQSTIIYRRDREIVWILNEREKTFFEVLSRQTGESQRPPSPAPADKPTLRRTGKTRRMLGHSAEQIIVKTLDAETEIWATRELAPLADAIRKSVGNRGMATGAEWEEELAKLGMFTLAATTRMGGKVYDASEVTRIEESAVPLTLFDVPRGFTRQGVNDMIDRESGPPK